MKYKTSGWRASTPLFEVVGGPKSPSAGMLSPFPLDARPVNPALTAGSGSATGASQPGRPNKRLTVGRCRRHIGHFRRSRWLRAAPQPKEARSVPVRAGDDPGDGGEACVGHLAPQISVWNDSDGVPLALVLAQEQGAGWPDRHDRQQSSTGSLWLTSH